MQNYTQVWPSLHMHHHHELRSNRFCSALSFHLILIVKTETEHIWGKKVNEALLLAQFQFHYSNWGIKTLIAILPSSLERNLSSNELPQTPEACMFVCLEITVMSSPSLIQFVGSCEIMVRSDSVCDSACVYFSTSIFVGTNLSFESDNILSKTWF